MRIYLVIEETDHDATLREVVDSDRKRIANIHGPVIERSTMAAEDRTADDIDHQMTKKVKTVNRSFPSDPLKNLSGAYI